MPTGTWTVIVQRPQQEVFDYLAQVSRHGEWSPKPWRAEGVTDPATVGTKFTSVGQIPGDKEHRNDVEVTEMAPPSRIVWVATEKGQNFVSTFVLAPDGSGTKVERTLEMPKPPGFLGVIFPVIMAAVVRPGVQKGMNQLKQRLESGTAGSASA
jgi:uncharacterized protein YndB with AHSA1/START domain